jgi:hypothetical protein
MADKPQPPLEAVMDYSEPWWMIFAWAALFYSPVLIPIVGYLLFALAALLYDAIRAAVTRE